MDFSLSPILKHDKAILYPLREEDFEALYAVASDPAIWEQHPNKDRWKKDVFKTFFDGAIRSKGAFKIVHKASGEVAGSTRFYDYDAATQSILIGYTFYATRFWGTGLNSVVKKVMLDYIFQYVATVYLHVGATNYRSQIAIERLGAYKVNEQKITYFGESPKLNFVYELKKENWHKQVNDNH